MNKKLVYLFMVLFVVACSIFLSKKKEQKNQVKLNLSELKIKDLNEHLINVNTFYGKPLIINYWATWCGPCREEFPYFEKQYKKYGNSVNFLMISAESIDKIIQFRDVNEYKLPFAQSQIQFNDLGIYSIPITAIYSAQGELLTTKSTPLNEDELNKLILDLVL